MFLAEVCPLVIRPHHSLSFYICQPLVFILATWPRRHLNLLPGLRELFFLVSLTLEANAKITLWILVVSWWASVFPPLFLFQLYHLNSFKTGPHLCCSLLWEITSHCPQEGFLRINFKLLYLVYKSLYDPALSPHQTNLSFCYTKLVSSTWNILLSYLCMSDSLLSFIFHCKYYYSERPSLFIKSKADTESLSMQS